MIPRPCRLLTDRQPADDNPGERRRPGRVVETQPEIPCPSCRHGNRLGRRFCAKCGSRLGAVCAACGTQNDPDEDYCGSCGAPISRTLLPGAARPAEARGVEAERRHLTVMFCDLVASTTLAERFDDEDLRDVTRRYYDACAETTRRYDGHVARYVGDGVLVYFGYPRAHEDDAERAVRAGLDMLAQLDHDFGARNAALQAGRGVRLAARIGIHTGEVVVGDLGGGEGRDDLALGETVNLTARLQGVAAPDTVVISGTTRRLVRGIFVLEDLGPQRLKGITAAVTAHRVVQPSGVRSRLDLAAGRLTPFTARHTELGVLLDCWERIQERRGQTVLVMGEAGIGKSRLVLALRERLADQAHTWLECRCSPYTQHTAFRPVIELAEQALGFQAVDTPGEKIGKLERALEVAGFALPETVPLLADFLSIPLTGAYAPLEMSPDVQRRKTLEALAAWNLALGEVQPVLLLVEDLHWCDPSSLELLGRLIEQSPTARVMIVCTARPEFVSPWPGRSNLTPLQLSRLTQRQAQDLVAALSPDRTFPEPVVDLVVARSDGVPLYVEELARMVLESGLLVEGDGRWQLAAPITELAIPVTLHDALIARLDRLSAAKEVAQRAAVLGRECSYALLARTAGLDEPMLRHGLAHLVEAEVLFQRGEPPEATYTFKHALIQEAAYQALLKRTRRQLHARIAHVLMAEFPTAAAAAPEVVARHYEAAGLVDQAVTHYQRAGEQATARSAHEEAIGHLRRAIALLAELPAGAERDTREVLLQVALGSSLCAARGQGHAETGAAYERAWALSSSSTGTPEERLTVLGGLAAFRTTRGDPRQGAEWARQQLALSAETGDTDHLLIAHMLMATAEHFMGTFTSSLAHAEEAIAIYDRARHRWIAVRYGIDQGAPALSTAGWNLWQLGYPDRALERAREAVGLARTLDHPFTLSGSLFFESVVHWLRGDPAAQSRTAEETIALSEAQGFPLWLGLAKVWGAAARAVAKADAIAVAEISEGLTLAAGTGAQGGAPALFTVLAQAQHAVGQLPEAMVAVETGLAIAAQTGQPFWDAELHRRKGELLLAAGDATEAEALFGQAIEIAREQGSRSLELRAAMSLARLLHATGRSHEARALLAPIYLWFTEGFDTRDLHEAKALLEELVCST